MSYAFLLASAFILSSVNKVGDRRANNSIESFASFHSYSQRRPLKNSVEHGAHLVLPWHTLLRVTKNLGALCVQIC